jgi:hypothetical protein
MAGQEVGFLHSQTYKLLPASEETIPDRDMCCMLLAGSKTTPSLHDPVITFAMNDECEYI